MIESDELQSCDDELPGFGAFLSQGAVVGALMGFTTLATSIILQSRNGYSFFLLLYLLPALLSGMVFGAFEGSLIWICTRFAGRRLHFVLRGCVGVGVHVTLMTLIGLLVEKSSPPPEYIARANYFYGIWFYTGYGLVLGVITGSRFEPWYELFRGTTTTPWRVVATGLTGIALRVVVIFAFMQSVLYLIWAQEGITVRAEYRIAVMAVIHFVVAGVIVFARMPSWLLVLLAVIINLPVILFVTEVLATDRGPMRMLTLIYLAIWFAFLVTRLSDTTQSTQNAVTT